MNAIDLIEAVLNEVPVSTVLDSLCETVRESDLAKTAYSLVKTNKGNWKSEKQGLFLINAAEQYSKRILSYESSRAADWLSRKGYDTSEVVAVAWQQMMKEFGRRDASKRRYTGTVLAFDEKGVLFIGTAKVIHPKKTDDKDHLKIDWSKVTTKYERPKNHNPSVVINYFNKPIDKKTIEVIKGVPNYEKHHILLSFLDQLNDGKKLSPKQKIILNSFLPEPQDVGLGSKEQWQKDLETFYSLVRTKFLSAFSDAITQHELKVWTNRNLTKEWADFTKGAKSDGTRTDLASVIEKDLFSIIGTKYGRLPKRSASADFFYTTRDKVKRAIKSKKPPIKSHLVAIEALQWLNKTLDKIPVSAIRAHYQLD